VKNRSLPALKAFSSSRKNSRRNSRPSTRTGRETGARSDPAGAVKRGPAAGNDAMDVRMMLQGLAPCVENHGHTELGAEMPGIGRDGGECLSRRAEQIA